MGIRRAFPGARRDVGNQPLAHGATMWETSRRFQSPRRSTTGDCTTFATTREPRAHFPLRKRVLCQEARTQCNRSTAMCDRDERRHNPLARELADFSSDADASSSESESESDDSAWDFAGEEHRARLSRWNLERERATRAAREIETLEAIRAARERREAASFQTRAFRVALEREDTKRWAEDVETCAAERAAERAAETLHEAYEASRVRDVSGSSANVADDTARERAAWDAHEAAWRAFVDSRASRDAVRDGETRLLSVSDIPWPPSTGEAAIAAVAHLERRKAPSVSLATARRRAFRTLSLRWHPDKFHAAHGFRLRRDHGRDAREPFAFEPGETHAEAVTRRVRGIAQELNDAWKTGRAR